MFFPLMTQHPVLKNRGTVHLRVTLYFCGPHWHSRGKGSISSWILHTLQSFCRMHLVKVVKNVNLVKLKLKNINKPDLTQVLEKSFTLGSSLDQYHINYSWAGLRGILRWIKCCWTGKPFCSVQKERREYQCG